MANRNLKVDSNHFESHTVSFDEKMKWIGQWPAIRSKVPSNVEACKDLSGMEGENRDWRTILSHIEKLLPLVNTKPITALAELINDCERRKPIKDSLRQIREKFPIEEMVPQLANLADTFITELPPPDLVINAIGSVLSGGFPFDITRIKK